MKISLSMTNTHAAEICMRVLEEGDAQGKQMAREHLRTMARSLDDVIDRQTKEVSNHAH